MVILANFVSNYLVDLIIIAITVIFLILALILEFKAKNRHSANYADKYLQVHQQYNEADSRYRATDLLVENFEDDLIDEIDRSIKDIEIENFYAEGAAVHPEISSDFGEHVLLEEDTLMQPQSDTIHDKLLKTYWVKMSIMLKTDLNIEKFALLEKDEDGLFSVVKNVDFSYQTVDTLKFTEFDKFYTNFFHKGLNLYITENVFQNSELSAMISPDDKAGIGELMFFPIRKNSETIGILCCARTAGHKPLEAGLLKNKIVNFSQF